MGGRISRSNQLAGDNQLAGGDRLGGGDLPGVGDRLGGGIQLGGGGQIGGGGAFGTPYPLLPTKIGTLQHQRVERIVVGDQDSRTRVKDPKTEFAGVGRSVVPLRAKFEDRYYVGTAFAYWRAECDGQLYLATAAHNVRSLTQDGKTSDVEEMDACKVEVLVDGDWQDVTGGVRVDPRYTAANSKAGLKPDADDGFDIAFIVMPEGVGKTLVSIPGVSNRVPVQYGIGATVAIVGYPYDKYQGDEPVMYGAVGTVVQKAHGWHDGLEGETVAYRVDTAGGESGSPVVMRVRLNSDGKVSDQLRCIGVHVAFSDRHSQCVNVATKITGRVHKFFREVVGPLRAKEWVPHSSCEALSLSGETSTNGDEL